MISIDALFKISYGLYIVCSGDKTHGNGFISNTVFQVTSNPAKFTVCCNKDNFTTEFILKHKNFSVSILDQNASAEIIGTFGYSSGKVIDKFKDMQMIYGETGVPIVLNESIAYLECNVLETIDVGTHYMFIGELLNAEILDISKEPLTYQYYRQVKKGVAPKNAPTYIDKSKFESKLYDASVKKYTCLVCGYEYDDANETVKFKDLPLDWKCPVCGAEKTDFKES